MQVSKTLKQYASKWCNTQIYHPWMWRIPCRGVIHQLVHLRCFWQPVIYNILSNWSSRSHFSSSVLPIHIFTLAHYREQSLHLIPREEQHTSKTNIRLGCIQHSPHGNCLLLLGEVEEISAMMLWIIDNQPYVWASSTYSLYIIQLFVFLLLCFVIASCAVNS